MGCFPRIPWPLRLGNSRGPGWAFPTASPEAPLAPGSHPPLPGSQAPSCRRHAPLPGWTRPGPLMPQSQRQNALRGPGRLLFVQRVPRCPGKHSGEGDSGARMRGQDEDHDTASWARATLRAETTGQAQWGPHRGQGLSMAIRAGVVPPGCGSWASPSRTRRPLAQSWGQRSWAAAAARTATRVSTMKTMPAAHTL